MSPTPPGSALPGIELAARVRELLSAGVSEHELEAGLVSGWAQARGVSIAHSDILNAVVAREHTRAASGLAGEEMGELDALVKAFEVLVGDAAAAEHGAVFTPETITKFMSEKALRSRAATSTVVDFSCGCGAFLIAALRQLSARGAERPSEIVARRLYGADLSAESVERARILLALAVIELGEQVRELSYNLAVGDSLELDWAGALGQASFDVILGNPPYVRYQQLSESARKHLSGRWETLGAGNYNLYFAFFELGEKLRAAGGEIALITPNTFFSAASAKRLRSWMSERAWIDEIIDFGHTRVFQAMTYTAISFSRGEGGESLTYELVEGLGGLAGYDRSKAANIPRNELGAGSWRLVPAARRASVARLGSGRVLGDIAQVRYGIATLRDKLYMVSGDASAAQLTKTHEGVSYPIETAATRALVRVSSHESQSSLDSNELRVIYPYRLAQGKAIILSPEEMEERHPQTMNYLRAIAPELARRDLGKKSYPQWYAYGRTQGLVPAGAKLLTPLYAASPRILDDPDPDDLICNGCAIVVGTDPETGKSLIERELLGVLLRSRAAQTWIENTSVAITGGFYAWQKRQLSSFSIPEISAESRAELLSGDPGRVEGALLELYGV